MGASPSRNDKVGPKEFMMERTDSEKEHSKQVEEERRVTDVIYLILMTFFYIILMAFIGYCTFHGDVYRIINGYDNCGNVCGRTNIDSIVKDCSGADMRNRPFLLIRGSSGFSVVSKNVQRECVKNCSAFEDYQQFLNRCIPKKGEKVVNAVFSKTGLKNFFQEVTEDFHLCWRDVVYLCLIALGSSVIIMVLLRFVVGVVVWFVLIGVSLACTIGTIYLWCLWKNSKNMQDSYKENAVSDVTVRKTGSYLAFAIVATIVTVGVILIIVAMRKRIQLVIQLFREAGKAVSAMPMLLFEPILTFIALAAVIALWFYFSIWIESSGYITESREKFVYYQKNFWIKFTRWFNLLGMLWMTQFIVGCQHMIIAGAVSLWYFTRNKSRLGTPIFYSAYNLLRYHLGSVALGSFIIALVQLVRIVLKAVEKFLKNRNGTCAEYCLKCCQCCLYCFEKILKYLSRNAYIEIAMYGQPFCKAGQQAFKLLVSNALRVTAINSVGDFVLFLGKVLVVMATVLIGIEILQKKDGLQHIWVPVTLCGLFAYFISHCFLTVYEMSIDTIFLCFCEDCEQNDGIRKPYFMSRGLMDFVENSKKAIAYKDQAWQEKPFTISGKVSQ